MIGIDTNVLLRYLVQDEPTQSSAANNLLDHLSAENPGWICIAVLLETVWSLAKTYKFNREQIGSVLDRLLASQDVSLEHSDQVQRALTLYRGTRTGFTDCLIAVCAKAAGCERIVTLDKTAARDLGIEQLGT